MGTMAAQPGSPAFANTFHTDTTVTSIATMPIQTPCQGFRFPNAPGLDTGRDEPHRGLPNIFAKQHGTSTCGGRGNAIRMSGDLCGGLRSNLTQMTVAGSAIVAPGGRSGHANQGGFEMGEQEVLVVVSKLKNYIRDASSFNTSGNVAPRLSDMIRTLCDGAIERARQDGRKTVMDRDFEFPGGA